MSTRNVAAIDLGAESGRVMLARFDGTAISLEEAHRFPNRPVRVRGHLFWDVLDLWREVLSGLRRAHQLAGTLDSVGVDTWGVDYGLVDAEGLLLGLPYHYRDGRTAGIMDALAASIGRERIYTTTGIQFLPFNTLYQLAAHARQPRGQLDSAHRLLLMPDLLHCWLSGQQVAERTNATTTQLVDASTGHWSAGLLAAAQVPERIMPPLGEPGTMLGPMLPEVRDDLGAGVRVALPATHDTGSAVAGIPVTSGANWAYISSGTWSLVGLELARPLISSAGLAANFTNEGGVFGTTRFLKNVMGLWLLQSCQRQWEAQDQPRPIAALLAAAAEEPPFVALLDPDDSSLLAPDDMPATINAWLSEHRQPPLQSPASFARSICESLVLRYCRVLRSAAALAGQQIEVIHLVGGGSQNTLMNQWLADATGVPVVAGPAETTALGNALMQLVALGELSTLAEVRALAVRSSTTTRFEPRPAERERWEEAAARLEQLMAAPIREK
ncbi:MAG TPA: FGGY-family carbohydrate kinase [Ktedonobacterales bacterium]|nr:FGGY-family carbohydrate kinase [Ktedonobacterales bacterium]